MQKSSKRALHVDEQNWNRTSLGWIFRRHFTKCKKQKAIISCMYIGSKAKNNEKFHPTCKKNLYLLGRKLEIFHLKSFLCLLASFIELR